MNDQRPTDPREQLEVRITALLLGEASAFEEAELLEAIKHDPALAAYYEEMRQMVKRVEETIQLTPVEASVSQPKLADARRDQLKELFKQPAPAKTVKLDSKANRVRRLGWLQHAAAIAAAMVILLAVVGMLLPAFSKSKSKTSLISRLMPQEPLIDHLGGSQASFDYMIEGRSTNFAINRQSAEFVQRSHAESRKHLQSMSQPGGAIGTPESADLDDRFLARFGSRRAQTKSSAEAAAPTAPKPVEAVRKPAEIYLPSASTDTAGVPVQSFATGVSRGLATDNTDRFYFQNEREDSIRNSDFGQTAAAVTDLPTLAFAVPNVSPPLPMPAPVPLELQTGRTELLTDSLARKGDAAPESEVVLGKKLAMPAPALATKSEVEELRPVTITGSKIPSSDAERRFRRLYDVEAKDSDFDGAALSAGSVRGRASGGTRGAQVDGLAALASVPPPQPKPSVPAAPGLAAGGAAVAGQPVAPLAALENQAPAANTLHADFVAMAAAPAVESFGRGVVADDFVASGQVTTELFAKQQADTKSDERLDRLSKETSLGLAVKEAQVPAELMYAERLLTEQRQLDREHVEELGKQVAVRAEHALDQVQLNARFIEVDGEDKRLLKELGDQVSARGEATKEQRERLQLRVADYDETTLRNELFSLLREPQGSEVNIRVNELSQTAFDTQSRFDTLALAESDFDSIDGRNTEKSDLSEKLATITLRQEAYEGLPLGEVLVQLQNEARRRDPRREGVEFRLVGQNSAPDFITDPVTGAPAVADVDVDSAIVNLPASDKLITLSEALDSIVAAADQPLEYAIENNAVVFRSKGVPSEIEQAPVVQDSSNPVPPPSLEPLPEIRTADNAFSTFSLNVSDVSFQLAASSLENGQMPDGARLRSEEFINAFDYRDPLPAPGQRVAFNWERARNPFAHNRELLRLSVQTAAAGREPGQPLNLVLLLDNSGSMERADRVQITEQMLRVLAAGLNDYDRISVISFARTPRLIVDGLPGGNHQALLDQMIGLNPDGGTNLEDALKLAYETAAKHFQANGNNRVILITDGAANLGNVDPDQLRERVIDQRKRGIALDCFGVGWEGYNDNLLESLSRNGDGRYGFLNDADNAVFEFSRQLAGALQVAAADVKAQIEFNPNRVTVYRQIGYQQHQLTKEQFRDNTVDAAEIGAAEAGNALYSVEVNPNGSGPIGTFRARYRVPSTGAYEEKEWVLDYTSGAPELDESAAAMRLASASAAFAEWLANSPYAQTVTPDALQNLLRDVPEVYAPDPRPAKLQAMIQQARAISGR